ncbi:MAG: DNA mismatch repair endonuclease MutL [Acidobacteria bacterium]|nr:DNA mismatch repair endonuclease MutL [Acidobacteriota bacterium]
MSRIRLLPDQLVSQIAAGEVVERPASVLKELVENALDAGARAIEIELESGGKGRIAVRDDGCGMGGDDALLAFDRHATSKIASFADLERVGSLGFRGEALAAIAAVARLELATAEEPGLGTRVRIEGGRILGVEPVSVPRGTAIEVRSLFFNVPARRKFLKATTTELRRCLEVVEGYALAWPEVRFALRHEGRTLLEAAALAPGANPEARVAEVLGGALAGQLVAIPPAPDEREPEWCQGFVGRPGSGGGRRLFTWINRRLVRDRLLNAAFYRAVREEWRGDEVPPLVLFLTLSPESVDVNVHPQKAEVRFRDSGFLDRLVARLRPALALARGEVPAPLRPPAAGAALPFAGEGLGGWSRPAAAPAGTIAEPAARHAGEEAGGAGRRIAELLLAPLERAPVPLSGRDGEVRPFRLLGQYKGALILLEGPDGLYLVDQHVAHERILFERLRRDLAGATPPSQGLLEPLLLELPASEAARLLELADELSRAGFELRELPGGQVGVTAIPAAVPVAQAAALLGEVAAGGGEGPSGLGERLLEAFAASLACRAAVKMHEPLAPAELERLLGELFACEQPYACPHGRPIVMVLGDAELERRFGRR